MSELVLKQFKAEWCGPCNNQEDLLEEFDAVPVEAIDVDENQDVANEYGVRGIPFLVLEEGGEVLESWQGVTMPDEIEVAVAEHS